MVFWSTHWGWEWNVRYSFVRSFKHIVRFHKYLVTLVRFSRVTWPYLFIPFLKFSREKTAYYHHYYYFENNNNGWVLCYKLFHKGWNIEIFSWRAFTWLIRVRALPNSNYGQDSNLYCRRPPWSPTTQVTTIPWWPPL